MSEELSLWRRKLQQLAGELMKLLTDLNELEKTFSRIHNEAHEMYNKIDEALDKNGEVP